MFFGSTYKGSVTDITALPVMAEEKGSTDYLAYFFFFPPLLCVSFCWMWGISTTHFCCKDSCVPTAPADLGAFGGLATIFKLFLDAGSPAEVWECEMIDYLHRTA